MQKTSSRIRAVFPFRQSPLNESKRISEKKIMSTHHGSTVFFSDSRKGLSRKGETFVVYTLSATKNIFLTKDLDAIEKTLRVSFID